MACLGCFENFLVETPCSDPIWLSKKVAGEINVDEYSVCQITFPNARSRFVSGDINSANRISPISPRAARN